MSNGLVMTPSRRSVKPTVDLTSGKVTYKSEIRTFLWDNPELRKAFKEARNREQLSSELRKAALAKR